MGKIATIEMVGPAGRVVCNVSDQALLVKKGYKPVGEKVPEPKKVETPKEPTKVIK